MVDVAINNVILIHNAYPVARKMFKRLLLRKMEPNCANAKTIIHIIQLPNNASSVTPPVMGVQSIMIQINV